MHVHYEELTDVARYIENHAHVTLEDQKATLDNTLHNITRFRALAPGAKVLEIGIGSGWFQIYCKQQGLEIQGLKSARNSPRWRRALAIATTSS